jgi:hypothetical protein
MMLMTSALFWGITQVKDDHLTLCYTPEERRSHVIGNYISKFRIPEWGQHFTDKQNCIIFLNTVDAVTHFG